MSRFSLLLRQRAAPNTSQISRLYATLFVENVYAQLTFPNEIMCLQTKLCVSKTKLCVSKRNYVKARLAKMTHQVSSTIVDSRYMYKSYGNAHLLGMLGMWLGVGFVYVSPKCMWEYFMHFDSLFIVQHDQVVFYKQTRKLCTFICRSYENSSIGECLNGDFIGNHIFCRFLVGFLAHQPSHFAQP